MTPLQKVLKEIKVREEIDMDAIAHALGKRSRQGVWALSKGAISQQFLAQLTSTFPEYEEDIFTAACAQGIVLVAKGDPEIIRKVMQ